jgi:hypothetical protein
MTRRLIPAFTEAGLLYRWLQAAQLFRYAMEHLYCFAALCLAFAVCGASHAADVQAVPSLAELQSIVGLATDSPEVRRVLNAYGFSKNPKRPHSWGSSCGVFVEVVQNKVATVGIRPPSAATNMATYPAELPRGLKPEDSIEAVRRKLGPPKSVSGDPDAQYSMRYDGLTVVTTGGRLFEVWLAALPSKAEPGAGSDGGSGPAE